MYHDDTSQTIAINNGSGTIQMASTSTVKHRASGHPLSCEVHLELLSKDYIGESDCYNA